MHIEYIFGCLEQNASRVRNIKKYLLTTLFLSLIHILGIENQSHVHYAMPVRNMLYDAMQLEKQVRDLASQHRKEGKNGTSEEYLSGMKKRCV